MYKIGLIQPPWHLSEPKNSAGPVPHPHTPLEFLYPITVIAQQRPEASAHLVDAHLSQLSPEAAADAMAAEQPDIVVLTTASGYNAWRVPLLDLELPARTVTALREKLPGVPILACGPHGSTSPDEALKALSCDGIIRGEPETVIAELDDSWKSGPYVFTPGKHPWNVEKAAVAVSELPAIDFGIYAEAWPLGVNGDDGTFLGGETPFAVDVEWSRGCQYACTFCNRIDFRNKYRERPIDTVLEELIALRERGVTFVHFIDDLFGLGKTPELLMKMRRAPIPAFGVQTRVDLWDEKGLDFLAAAGCAHIRFGLESPLAEVQKAFHREYQYTLKRTEEVLLHAISRIGSIEVTLMETQDMSLKQRKEVLDWREKMLDQGCSVAEPVKAFPYPGTLYFKNKVAPEPITADGQWEKANKYYALEASAV